MASIELTKAQLAEVAAGREVELEDSQGGYITVCLAADPQKCIICQTEGVGLCCSCGAFLCYGCEEIRCPQCPANDKEGT